jgi:hypothetical protein
MNDHPANPVFGSLVLSIAGGPGLVFETWVFATDSGQSNLA